MRTQTTVLPNEFKYDHKTKTLFVEYTDGSQIKYFDIEPTSIFLLNGSHHRFADFIRYVETFSPRSELVRKPTKRAGAVIQEEPDTKETNPNWKPKKT
jgi:hypothetical protein